MSHTVKHFHTRGAADEVADEHRSRPSRSNRAFRVIEEPEGFRIRRDTYRGRKVTCCVLCTDGRFRHTNRYYGL